MRHDTFTLTRTPERSKPPEIELTVVKHSEPPIPLEELCGFLSPDERERANRLRFPQLRQTFRACRGMLRVVLSRACGRSPGQLSFSYSAEGKPSLSDFPGLHFNATHSGELWACAISRDAPVGVDLEQIRPLAHWRNIARRFFAVAEYEALDRFPDDEYAAAFFRCWTRKEAYVKALGAGLTLGLATFQVSCADDEVSPVLDTLAAPGWFVHSFVPAPGYLGALAAPGKVTVRSEQLGQ